jgi:hypothetical protein
MTVTQVINELLFLLRPLFFFYFIKYITSTQTLIT